MARRAATRGPERRTLKDGPRAPGRGAPPPGYVTGVSFEEDPPTRRLPREPVAPRAPTPPRGPVPPREPVPPGDGWAPQDDGAQLAVLEQRLASLRSWLVALAVIAVLALVVAAVALVSSGGDDETTSSSSGGSTASLRRSVDRLEKQIDDRATDGDLSDLKDEVQTLKTAAAATSTSTTSDSPDDAAQVSELSSSLDALDARVNALEQAGGTTAAPGDGTTTEP